jgi:hypothetical protein
MNTKNLVGKKAIVMIDNSVTNIEKKPRFEETWHAWCIGDVVTILKIEDPTESSPFEITVETCNPERVFAQSLPLEYLWILD